MVQVIPRSGGAAGIGAAFGKGLGDQIPKEVDRYRLSQSLANLDTEGKTPMEVASAVAQATYDRPDIGQQILPYAMKQARRDRYIKRHGQEELGADGQPIVGGGGQGVIPQGDPGGQFATPQGVQGMQQPEGTGAQAPTGSPQADPGLKRLVTKEDEEILRAPLPVLSESDKRAMISRELARDPYADPEELDQYFTNQVKSRRDELQAKKDEVRAKRDLKGDLQNSFKDYVETRGQQNVTDYDNFTGRMYKDMLEKAEEAVVNGMSTEEAAKEFGEKFLPIADDVSDLNRIGSQYIGLDANSTMKSLKQIREDFKEIGALEDFDKQLRARVKLTPYTSSLFTYPPSGDARKTIDKFSKYPPPMFGLGGKARDKYLDNMVKDVADNMKESDMPFTMAMMASNKGVPFEDFMSKFSDLHSQGKIKLNNFQADQFKRMGEYPSSGTLDERLFLSVMGMDKIANNAFEEG